MPASIFKGSKVKTLKDTLTINDKADILTGSADDPRTVAKDAPAGSLFIQDTTGKHFRKKDAGSSTNWELVQSTGDGEKNFIENGKAEVDTTGWATYADAAASRPVDGTGGTANITFTRSTSSPLSGDGHFLFTKDAVNRQGQGASYNFTIDSTYQAKVLTIEMDYKVISGTFVAGTATADSDLIVYLYDTVNNLLIEPSSFKLLSNSTTISDTFRASFQTPYNSTSYRLIIHTATTSASAFVVAFDNIKVTPSKYVFGTPVTDWAAFTPTGSWTTNTTYAGRVRRVGDQKEYDVRLLLSGAPNNSTLVINIPDTIDTSKLSSGGSVFTNLGMAQGSSSGNGYNFQVIYSSTSAVNIIYQSTTTGSQSQLSNTVPVTWANGNTIHARFSAPIVGLSSSVQMSDSADTRVVALRANKSAAQSIPNSAATVVIYPNVNFDDSGTYNSITGVYTVGVSGKYRITAMNDFAASGTGLRQLAVSGTNSAAIDYRPVGSASGDFMGGSTVFSYVAGDTISVSATQASGGALNIAASGASYNYLCIERLTGPSAVAANESIMLKYTTLAGQNYAASDVNTVLQFGTKAWDSHGAWNTALHRFTAPTAGKYRIATFEFFNAQAWTAGSRIYNFVRKNGTTGVGSLGFLWIQSSVTLEVAMPGYCEVDLLAGEYIEIIGIQNSGVTRARSSASVSCDLYISKVDNK